MSGIDWMTVAYWLGSFSVLTGAVVFLGAAIGLVRFPDLYIRSSAVATAAGLGLVYVIVGAFLMHPEWPALPKVIVAVLLQLVSSAIGSMAIARAGYLSGARPTDTTLYSQVPFIDREMPEEVRDPDEEPGHGADRGRGGRSDGARTGETRPADEPEETRP